MKSVLKRTTLATAILISISGQFIACSGSDNSNTGGAAGTTGGSSSVGGTSAAAGTHTTGGNKATGGANATGGSSSNGGNGATGGSKSTGGASSTGGSPATGGSSTAGGNSATGGSGTAGGNSATGGKSTVGGSSATGGSSTPGGNSATGGKTNVGGSTTVAGSSATGGSSTAGGASGTGGSSTAGGASGTVGGTTSAGGAAGGAATGGVTATGGMSATGGTTALLPEAAVLNANSPACLSCAQSSCTRYLDNAPIDTANGYGSCQTVTGAANSPYDTTNEPWAVTAWAGDPYPVTQADYSGSPGNGFSLTGFDYCMDLLTCLMQSKCDQGVLSACFCGSAVGTDCINSNNVPGGCADPTNPTVTKGCAKASTGPVNGKCVAEEENALDTNSLSTIPTAFADVTVPGGPANQLVNCLANNCATQCSL